MADRIRKRGWITLRTPDRARWRDEIPVVKELLDKALAHLPGAMPWQPETVEALMRQFLRIADLDLILFAEADGKTVGWFPGIPNVNEALIHANGLRYPWDWLRLAVHMRRTPEVPVREERARAARVLAERRGDPALRRDAPPGPGEGLHVGRPVADRLGEPLHPRPGTRSGPVYKRYRVYRIAT